MSRKRRKKKINYNAKDYHHIFFQGRHYKQGWAKVLREHKYCGGYIPQFTLHRAIHSKVHDVPTPNSDDCKKIVRMLDSMLESNQISTKDRLDIKIGILADCFRKICPATTAILDWQKDIVAKFYDKGD